jgi:hypothetical protein
MPQNEQLGFCSRSAYNLLDPSADDRTDGTSGRLFLAADPAYHKSVTWEDRADWEPKVNLAAAS